MCLLLLALGCALTVQGYAEQGPKNAERTAPAPTGETSGSYPDPRLQDSSPVLDLRGREPDGAAMPRRTLALTFEDGPDPEWTPALLAVLRRHHAHATFFVLGSKVAASPELTRRILAEGHEIGSHTHTHTDLAGPAWRRALDLGLFQNALAGTAGVHTRLLRPPYSSVPSALPGREYAAARQAGRDGYLVVLADHDGRDTSGRTTKQILQASTPTDGRGAVVRLHDAGGERAATVAAVDQLLTKLAREDYRFTTVSGGLRLAHAEVPATRAQRLAGGVLVWAQRAGQIAVTALTIALAVTGIMTVGRILLLVLLAGLHAARARRVQARTNRRERRAMRARADALRAEARVLQLQAESRRVTRAGVRTRRAQALAERAHLRARDLHAAATYHPGVSIIVPAYNEDAGIEATVRSLMATDYPGPFEVIVVDDGSTDDTARIAATLDVPDVLTVVRQPNSGKAAALNTGIAYARHAILVLVDGDTVFQADTIERLVAPLADPDVGAVSGNTKVGNTRGILGRWQHIEYVIGFNLDRRMYDVLECMPTVPGAIGAFRWDAIAGVGGISTDTLAEDTDLTMAICRLGWRVVYEQTALAWTEAPSSLSQLWRQRYRWCYGTLQSMWKHRHAFFQRGPAGRFGRRGLTYLALFHIVLPLLAPAVDVFAVYGVVFGDTSRVLMIWLMFVAMQGVVGAYALRLDHERLGPLWSLPLQQLVYRQLMYLVVIQSVVTALLGAPLRWHAMRREGTFADAPPPEVPQEVPARSLR